MRNDWRDITAGPRAASTTRLDGVALVEAAVRRREVNAQAARRRRPEDQHAGRGDAGSNGATPLIAQPHTAGLTDDAGRCSMRCRPHQSGKKQTVRPALMSRRVFGEFSVHSESPSATEGRHVPIRQVVSRPLRRSEIVANDAGRTAAPFRRAHRETRWLSPCGQRGTRNQGSSGDGHRSTRSRRRGCAAELVVVVPVRDKYGDALIQIIGGEGNNLSPGNSPKGQ